MPEEHELEFSEKDCVEYIYKELLAQGLHISEEVIEKVIDLEFKYMVSIGMAVEVTGDEE